MTSKTEKPEWRDFDCPRYNRCLDRMAKTNPNGRFDCGNCVVEIVPGTDPEEKEESRMEEKKMCIKCRKEFPKTEEFFRKNAATLDGFEGQCKKCRKKYFEDYRERKKNEGGDPKGTRSPRGGRDEKPGPASITKATPVEIVNALRKGLAQEIIQMIEERFV